MFTELIETPLEIPPPPLDWEPPMVKTKKPISERVIIEHKIKKVVNKLPTKMIAKYIHDVAQTVKTRSLKEIKTDFVNASPPKKHQKVYDYPVWPTICKSDKKTIRPLQIISEKRVPKANRRIAEWDGKFNRYIIFKNINNPKFEPYFICPIPNDKSPLQYFGGGPK